MKRFLLALTMVGFLLPLAPRAQAETEVSLNFFYDDLSPYGNWIEVGDYGYCFQPNVAVSNSDWRPYADGYWAYTDVGWTWVSYEDFGWATYHYGRWSNLADYGWVWVPGYEWGPAWVSWRTGGDYIGWAPLPPVDNGIYEGRAITGQVDVLFDIGPLYYNFCDVRYIGEPVLRGRIFAPSRNLTIINQTVNVTNITYNNSIVYNYGPDYNRLNQYSTRPIQRLSLQRETAVGGNFSGKRGNLNRVNGNQLVVVAPTIQKSQEPIAPKQVKAKVEQPKVERGWQGVANRQQLQEEMKKENAQNVRPPSFQPQKGRKRDATAAGQNATAQPNEAAKAVPPGPGTGNEQQAARAAHKAQRNGRDQNAGRPEQPDANANGNAEQASEQQRAERAQRVQERQAQQRQAEQPGGQEIDHNKTKQVERAQEADAQQSNRARQQTEQAQEAQRAERARSAAQAQESQRAARAEQAQQAQESQRAEQARRNQEARQSQQALPPERAQRPPQIRRPEQARPPQPQENQNPNAERKNKKKKPGEEPPPQP